MKENTKRSKWTLVIHGGAGGILKSKFTPEDILEYEAVLKQSLQVGGKLLEEGHSSLDAVQKAVMILEDSPLFNAGKGSVFNEDGFHELDASLMDGRDLRVGAVTGATKIKNPILAARQVLEHSPHCLLAGRGADQFALDKGLEMVDQEYFFTQRRWEEWQNKGPSSTTPPANSHIHGTVGAVARDSEGHLAAATSTGGLTYKYLGRVSDSSIVGAGNFADDATCAISTTGTGDFFIRQMSAVEVSHRMAYLKWNLEKSAHAALQKVKDLGGEGGIIGVDRDGNGIMIRNTPGMFRGMIKSDGKIVVEMF